MKIYACIFCCYLSVSETVLISSYYLPVSETALVSRYLSALRYENLREFLVSLQAYVTKIRANILFWN